jgi:undecaprenyl-diphosphatase
MLEALAGADRAAFYAINHATNALFDRLMPLLSDDGLFKPLFVLVFVLLVWRGGRRGRWAALLVVPLLALSDQASSNLLKHAVERVRPCSALPDVRLLAGCSGSFSMPSSHAANSCAAAVHFALFYPRLAVPLALLAFGVGYSRVYLGVHYPGDVLVGFLVGAAAALLVQLPYRVAERRRTARPPISADRTTAAARAPGAPPRS